MKQQQTARETLAEAHKHMTPEQIAAHALGLAEVVEAYHEVANTRGDAMKKASTVVRNCMLAFNGAVREVRQIESLFERSRKVEGRRRLVALARTEVLTIPEFSEAQWRPLLPIPPMLFSPPPMAAAANANDKPE